MAYLFAVAVVFAAVILYALWSKDRVKAGLKVFGAALFVEAENTDRKPPPPA